MVVDGVLEHGDNISNAGALTTGDVQWMTAERGIIHRQLAFRDERAHTLQLWVNVPGRRKLTGTRYRDLLAARRPVVEQHGVRVDVIAGQVGDVTGPAVNEWPFSGAIIKPEPGRRLDHVLPARDRAFLYVLADRVMIAGRAVTAGQTAWSDPLPEARAAARPTFGTTEKTGAGRTGAGRDSARGGHGRGRVHGRPRHQARNVDRTRCGRLGGAPDERGLQVAARSPGRAAGNSMTRTGQSKAWS